MSSSLQVLRGTSVTVTETFQVDGVPADLDAGVPTVAAFYPDGTALTPAPVASGAWTGRTTGQYRVVLDAQAEVTVLDPITWVGNIGAKAQTLYSRVEWVGALLFNLAELRAMKVAGGFPFSLTAIPLYTDAQIMETRAAILEEFEEILGFSPVPRHRRETLDGDGRTGLILPGLKATRVLSVTVNGAAQTATNYQIAKGYQIEAVSDYSYGTPFTWGRRNVTIEWVHGWERPKGIGGHIAMIWTGAQLNPSGFSSASTISMPDGSTYTYEPSEMGRGGFRRPSGIREADRWFDLHAAGSTVAAR